MKAMVTGASSGIGRDIALNLAKLDYDLILVGRNREALEEVKTTIDGKVKVKIVVVDLSNLQKVKEEIGATPLTWGSLGQGILTGKYDRNCTFDSKDRRSRDIYVNFHGDKLLKNLNIVDIMRPIARTYHQCSLPFLCLVDIQVP